MLGGETISFKKAAMDANVHDQAIRRAVNRGLIKACRERGRVLIIKDSFDEWRKRLEIRRELRQRERDLMTGTTGRA